MTEIKLTLAEALREAMACHRAGNHVEAERIYRAILKVAPDHPKALNLMGTLEVQRGRYQEGIRLTEKALAIRPDYVEALNNRGNALAALRRQQEALESYDKALAIRPDYVEALNNRGRALAALGRRHEALESYDKALAIRPDHIEVLNNRGRALAALGRRHEALESYDKALAIRPDHVEALNNRGNALAVLGRQYEAINCFNRVLAIKPGRSRVHSNLIFTLNFDPSATTADHQAERARWNKQHAQQFAAVIRPHLNEPDPHRRLRIGYVSSHFRHQAATYAFGGVLLNHSKSFEVICYSDTLREDDLTAQFRACVGKWRHTAGLSDDELADLIRADAVDILVDLVGHMRGHRLLVFARKPAPVQVTAWGEPTGTGLSVMDYLLADPVLIPAAERALLVEQVVDLPNFLGYWAPDQLPEPSELPALRRGYVTFGSFNRVAKIGDSVLRTWASILRALPHAYLVLKALLADSSQRARIRDILAKEGIASERVKLLEHSDRAGHFIAYHEIDIALDPFPHSGGMTTLDALWMGVPVVTCPGGTISSRLAAASLTALGLTDFIAPDLDTYVELAIAKTADITALSRLRGTLRKRIADSAFGDPARYTSAVEAAYREMWRRWCAASNSRSQ